MDENEIVRRAMGIIGSRKTAAKAAASRANGLKGGRPNGILKPLSEFECKCGQCPDAPKTYCPRGRAILRRRAAAAKIEATQANKSGAA